MCLGIELGIERERERAEKECIQWPFGSGEKQAHEEERQSQSLE